MFKLNLKIALRSLWRHKGFTLINVGGLAIGLASCMILLLYVTYEWSYDKQVSNADKTYIVYQNSKNDGNIMTWFWTTNTIAGESREKIPGVANSSHFTYPDDELLSYENKNFKKAGVYADEYFLKIMDYKVLRGNPEKALKGQNSIVLTQTMAKMLFGNADPINKTVKLQNSEVLKVEAVIEDVSKNSTIRFDYLLPWTLMLKFRPWNKEANWGNNFCLNLVQLKDNRFFKQVNQQMKGIYVRNAPNSSSEAFLHPLSKWHLYDKFEQGKLAGGKIDQVKIFLILAFCILLIACINFMNLATARSEKRAREVGVRKAIGSSRKALVRQFLMESFLLAFMGMIIAFVLIELSLPYFNGLLNIELKINYNDWRFWTGLLGLTLITGAIAGSYPAFYLSSFEPVKVLKGFGLQMNASVSVRKVLVVFQFVFAVCLIICTTMIYQQLNYVKNKPIGYNREGLVEIPIQGNLRNKEKLALLKERLLNSGSATALSYFSTSMGQTGNNTYDFSWPGKNPKSNILIDFRAAGQDFAKTVDAKMLSGRDFSAAYTDTANAVLNEAAVKVMGLKQPVGTVIKWDGRPYTVVGVIQDLVMGSPYQQAAPMVMYYFMNDMNYISVRLNPAQNVSASVAKIDEIVKEINPDFPVDRKFVSDQFEQKFQNEQLLGTMSNWFGGFAIFISCLGLLGLALFMAEQRKKEISIRKVLGASTGNILTLLNRDFVKLVLIANLIAFPLAYVVVNHWLSAYSFRISISVLPFLMATMISLLIAVLTVSVQSVKVAKSNAVDALKYE